MSKTYYGQCRLADKKPHQSIKKKNVHNWGGLVISITWLEKKDQLGRFTVEGVTWKEGENNKVYLGTFIALYQI